MAQAFASFGPAVAAASIAQVHRGETERDGVRTSVAVKVLRPNVASRFRRDLADFFFVAHKAEAHSAEARRLRLIEVINTMSRSVAMEMDLRLEAAALSEMAENTRDDPDFRVPTVDWDRTTHNVLTMEWIDGIALSDHARLEQSQVDLPELGRKVIQSFLRHALRDGFFHADMHPGNLFLDDAGRLVAVDFGIMGRLGMKERRFLAEILLGFITRDYRRVAEVHFEAGYVPGHHSVENFAQAIRAIGEPIHNRTAEEISMAKLLTLLLEVTGLFDMRTRPELILLQKTMVVVEGVARGFDPETRHLEGRRSRGARMDRAQSRPDRAHPGRDVRRRRARPRAGGPAGDRLALGGGAGAAGDHDPGGPDAVAGDHRGDGPRPRAARAAGAPWRSGSSPRPLSGFCWPSGRCDCNAMHIYDSIAIIIIRRRAMASLTIRKLDDAIRDVSAAARGPQRPLGRGRGAGDPAREPRRQPRAHGTAPRSCPGCCGAGSAPRAPPPAKPASP